MSGIDVDMGHVLEGYLDLGTGGSATHAKQAKKQGFDEKKRKNDLGIEKKKDFQKAIARKSDQKTESEASRKLAVKKRESDSLLKSQAGGGGGGPVNKKVIGIGGGAQKGLGGS